MRKLLSLVFAAALLTLGPAVAVAADQALDGFDLARIVESANQELGLRASAIVELQMDRTPSVAVEVNVPIDGQLVTLDLHPHSVRSPLYEVRRQLADGSYVTAEPGPVRTLRGTVAGAAGSSVAGSMMPEGLVAVVNFPDGRRRWIEPLFGTVSAAGAQHHVVYRDEDVLPHGGSCATDAAQAIDNGISEPFSAGDGCAGEPCVAELAFDADVEYFNDWGDNVEARINAVTNAMNMQYETEVGITHEITTIIVREAEPDPYSGNTTNTLLNQFRSFWIANHEDVVRDVAQLFTGKNVVGGPIGQAWTIGGICTSSAFCVAESDFNGAFSCATDLSAHELGHLWNGSHCSCPSHTMNPGITCANTFHPTLTIPDILFHRDTRSCLTDLAPITSLPFADDFVEAFVDPALWVNEGAVVDATGDDEPSEPFSLHLDGDDRVTSGLMDVTGLCGVTVEYFWQRTGTTGQSPEAGEDLVLQYRTVDGVVETAAQHPGAGGDNEPYQFESIVLPEDAVSDSLQIRFRILGAEASDDFFVDDVRVFAETVAVAIATQPELDQACLGGTGEFTVEPSGDPPFAYQWFKEGSPIAGATEQTLVITPVDLDDLALYSVEVSNGCSSVTSVEVPLLEADPIEITMQPQGDTVGLGDIFATTVSAIGAPEYQWFLNDVPIEGATEGFFFIPSVTCEDQGCYHVELTNDCGSAVSDIAELVVDDPTCPPFDCADSLPPVIEHASGLPGETRPHSGYIDPRLESTNGVEPNLGITDVAILFSETVENADGTPLSADAFSVTETGPASPPSVIGVDTTNMPLVIVSLDRPITLKEWTTIRASVRDLSANVIVDDGNQGAGVDEGDRVDVAFLPGDVDQNGAVAALDLLRFRQISSGVFEHPQGIDEDYIDTDRNGDLEPLDLLRFRQLLFGTSPATQAWSGEQLNSAQP